MRSPIRALQDFSRKRKLATVLYDNLKRARPGGIDVSRQDAEGAAALMYLLQHRSDVQVVKNRHNLTLMFTEDAERVFHSGTAASMHAGGVFAARNEDLIQTKED